MLYYLIPIAGAFVGFKIYKGLKCPKELEHIPAMPLSSFFSFVMSQRAFDEKMKEEFQPMMDKYGIIRVFGMTGWTLMISDPKLSKEIAMKPEIFCKVDPSKMPTNIHSLRFFGKSQIAINNGQEWKRHRKIINPIFHQSWSTELFGQCVQDLIEQWEKQEGGEVVVYDLIQRLTLDILGKAIFDIDFKSVKEPNSKLFDLYTYIVDRLFNEPLYFIMPFLENVPYFKRTELGQKLKEYDEFVESIIEERTKQVQTEKISNKDLVTSLIQSNDNEENEIKLTKEEIRDNVKIFILAGQDTTSNTLTNTLYYLARYPEIQDKLRHEILNALGHPNELIIPTLDQLKNIPYMDLVNKESMRIMTTSSAVQRVAAEDYTLSNGIVVPKGTDMYLHLWGIHHNSTFFPNPDEFNPERFKDLSSEESRNWQPFFTGSRACIGISFSMLEQRVAIAMLLQKFELSIESTNPDYDRLRLNAMNVIRPKDLKLTLKSRF